jgi:glutathione S-transferase
MKRYRPCSRSFFLISFEISLWCQKLPTAITRYHNEAKRLVSVIESHLAAKGTHNLIGNKVTYVDLAWVPWNFFLDKIVVPGWEYEKEYPLFAAWHRRLMERDAVQKVFESKDFNYSLAH